MNTHGINFSSHRRRWNSVPRRDFYRWSNKQEQTSPQFELHGTGEGSAVRHEDIYSLRDLSITIITAKVKSGVKKKKKKLSGWHKWKKN